MRFFGIDSELDRRRLQALRADPPGWATNGARRSVFGAALEQWDALLRASAQVVPAASPILLFYALSQAGRAVSAAHVHGQPFRSRGHGLRIEDPTGDLGATVVQPEGGANTSFAMFCRAIGSPGLTEATTLGALWAANPKLEVVPALGDGETPALELMQVSGDPAMRAIITGDLATALPTDAHDAAAELRKRLAPYPGSAEGLVVNTGSRISRDGTPQVEVSWRSPDGTARAISLIAPGYGRPNSGAFLRPALNAAGDVLDYLPLWWAILLTLSSLARYHPEAWTAALMRDRARTAVPIEEALGVGREMLPWLLLGALEP